MITTTVNTDFLCGGEHMYIQCGEKHMRRNISSTFYLIYDQTLYKITTTVTTEQQ